MHTLFQIHSDLRWIIVILAAAVIARLALGLIRHTPTYDRLSRGLVAAFSGVIDLQVTLGIIYMIWDGAKYDFWPRYRFEHAVTMLIAAGVAHLTMRWRSSPAPVRYRNELIIVILTLVIIIVGVARLPEIGGTNRWLHF